MRIPKRISPSALAKFEKDRQGYFFTYLSEPRTERDPQSPPASVGSAFDAFVKGRLMFHLFGEDTTEELFESQVESQCRDFARVAGKHVFDEYVAVGNYQRLLYMMEHAKEEPQFEFDADITLDNGVVIAGKPDCRFIHRDGAHVILDWKVNGYCGKKSGVSPAKGFQIIRDGLNWPKPSRSNGKFHKYYDPSEFLGLEVNANPMFEYAQDWADQTTMYAWMMGEPVGDTQCVSIIEQIVAKPQGKGAKEGDAPLLRFATHVNRLDKAHQVALYERIAKMRQQLISGIVFEHLDAVGNTELMEELNCRARAMQSDGTDEGDFFAHCVRPQSFYKGR